MKKILTSILNSIVTGGLMWSFCFVFLPQKRLLSNILILIGLFIGLFFNDKIWKKIDYYMPGIIAAIVGAILGYGAGQEFFPEKTIISLAFIILGAAIGFFSCIGGNWGSGRKFE